MQVGLISSDSQCTVCNTESLRRIKRCNYFELLWTGEVKSVPLRCFQVSNRNEEIRRATGGLFVWLIT